MVQKRDLNEEEIGMLKNYMNKKELEFQNNLNVIEISGKELLDFDWVAHKEK